MFSAYKFLTKDIRVFKCEILLKMLNSGHCQKKKKKKKYDCNTLPGKRVF